MYLPRTDNYRVVRSGRVLEVMTYKSLVPVPKKISDASPSARRRQLKLRRTICSNSGYWYKANGKAYLPFFMTLTFAHDVSAVEAKRAIYLFFKRVNYSVYDTRKSVLKYSYVIEPTKRGRPHFHVILYNLPWVPNFKAQFEAWWSHGFVRINSVRDVRNVGAYVVKYMSKRFGDDDVWPVRTRLYTNTQKLLQPVVYRGDDAMWYVSQLAGVTPWLFERGVTTNYRINYLGQDGLPMDLSPPRRRPDWLVSHDF